MGKKTKKDQVKSQLIQRNPIFCTVLSNYAINIYLMIEDDHNAGSLLKPSC
jgi:hypothetical protein